MKKIIPLLITLFVLTSCEDSNKTQLVKIKNQYAMEIPASLSVTTDLNDEASLQYQNVFKEFYIITIDEPKVELKKALAENELSSEYSADLKGYTNLLLTNVKASIKLKSMSEIEETTINGLKAQIVSIEGNLDNLDIYWKFAFIEGKTNYYQIMAWTTMDHKMNYEKQIDKALHSFKELNKSIK
ncbi:hypothetical protein [Flavobacterium sp. '19STA2R22 D10 B1']|uniref:hypothetical protein n=1 Tax=Flavobacterium aerium TaxID=3037261 RepID=UPI00278C6153|nr:hypothetical protein [Flavobacterium sp. '19STA2R22 D10 B1']